MAAAAAKDKGDVSTDFLRDYIAQGGKVVDKESGDELDPENVDAFLEEAGGGEKEQPESRKAMSARAEKATTTEEERQEKARAKEEQQRAEEEAKKQAAKNKTLRGAAADVSTAIVENAQPLADRFASLSTVGGIGLLLVILVLLLFIVVQVNAQGDTRLKQLWYMINGQARLQGRVVPTGRREEIGTRLPGTGQSQTSSSNGSGPSPLPFTPLLAFPSVGGYRGQTPF